MDKLRSRTMKKPPFNVVEGKRILNRQTFNQWRNDNPETKSWVDPIFYSIELKDGSTVNNVISETKFNDWLDAQ